MSFILIEQNMVFNIKTIALLPLFLLFCPNARPNGGVAEYLLYLDNQMVYRGKERQHNITGNGDCVCFVVCATVHSWRDGALA